MSYLTEPDQIQAAIRDLSTLPILWIDTEVADWWTPHPKLSLIQVLGQPDDASGETAILLDVLDQPNLVELFIAQLMTDAQIEKVFHNASYDLRFLGRSLAQNVTCTLKLARRLPRSVLGTTDCKLKTLAKELCGFTQVDQAQQASNWGQRPLSQDQLLYARMDTVYLSHVHRHLLRLTQPTSSLPARPNSVNPPAHSSFSTPSGNPKSFSVTKVRVAFECARLFYLNHHFNSPSLFLPKDQEGGIGSAFHELSAQFVKIALSDPAFSALLQPDPKTLNPETIAPVLKDLFYRLVFFPYLQSAAQQNPSKASALHQLWQGLSALIQRWAELLVSNRRHCAATEVFAKTFLAQELNVQHAFSLPHGGQQLIRGRFDSLIYDFEQHRLCVVEYKTYQSPDPSAQLAQVALYSYMLRERVGVPINSAVYSVLPDWKELTFTWDELEHTVYQLIPHKLEQMQQWVSWQPGQPDPPPSTAQSYLCDICPQHQKCQTFFAPQNTDEKDSSSSPPFTSQSAKAYINVNIPQPNVPPEPTSPETERLAQDLVTTLKSFGVGVTYCGAAIGPAFVRVKLKPDPGVKVSSLLRLSDDLRVQLGLANPPLIAPQAGYVSVDLPRSDRQVAEFDRYIQRQSLPATDPIRIAIGIDLEGQLVEADLSDPNTCHFLIGGTTGSGKSEFLKSLLLSLIVRHPPEALKIVLVDPKRVTFPEFETMDWLYQPVVKEGEQAIGLMESLVAEMNARYHQFEINRCNDLLSYNKKISQTPRNPLPRIVCIFDEYADFMAEKEMKTALEQSIKRLGAMARAAGIHLIIATQRPDASIVTPIIRSNLPGRVALRTASEADSAIILGGKQIEAACLLGKGDLLFQAGSHLLRLQSLYAPIVRFSSQ